MSFSIDELAKSSRPNEQQKIYNQTDIISTLEPKYQRKRKRSGDLDHSIDLPLSVNCSSSSSYSDDSVEIEQPKKKSRTQFTNSQILELEKYYITHKYLLVEDRPVMAKKLKLSQTQVKWWFQNRRMKEKRQLKSGNFCGPLDMSQFVSVGKSGQRLYNFHEPGYFNPYQQYPVPVPMVQSYLSSPMLPTMYPGYSQQYYNGLSPQPVQNYRV